MALEVADKGIRINGIAPGAIATMMNLDILEGKAEEDKIPMHRIGEPNEIAKVAVFLFFFTKPTFMVNNSHKFFTYSNPANLLSRLSML